MSVLANRPDLVQMIQERYALDFLAFGYSTDVNHLLPLEYGPEKRRRSRVPEDITMHTLCTAQVPFGGSACAAFSRGFG